MAKSFSRLANLEDEEEDVVSPKKSSFARLATMDDESDGVAIEEEKQQEEIPWWKQATSEAGRQVGLTGRAVAQGVAALPLMAMDAGVGARNLITKENYELPSEMWNRSLDEYLPKPESWAEKATGLVESTMTGARIPVPQASSQAPMQLMPRGNETLQALPSRALPLDQTAPLKGGLTGAQQAALQQGETIGMKTTPGQARGSRPLQQFEAKLESQPWSSGPANAIKENNQAVLNRSWAKAIGENSDVVDSTVLSRANDRLGEVFESVRDARPRTIDPDQFTNKLGAIESEFEGLLPQEKGIANNPLVKRLMVLAANGSATGEQLGGLTSKLGKAAAKEMSGPNGDRDMGMALFRVKDYVDDLVSTGLSKEEAEAYNTARKQYRSLMQLTSRVGNVNPNTGNVSGATMANYLQKSDKKGFLQGANTSDAYKATRFSQAFKPIVGDSGTATRSSGSGLSSLLGIVPKYAASKLYYGRKGGPPTPSLNSLLMGSIPAANAIDQRTDEE